MNPGTGPKQTLKSDEGHSANFMPDLCQVTAVLFLLLSTQLFALIITLITSKKGLIDWEFLGLLSVYCHCIVLSCATVICQSRPWLANRSVRLVAAYCLSAIIAVSALFSWMFTRIIPSGSLPLEQDFILRSVLISALVGGILLRYFYLQHQWRLQKQAELRARLQALQARIRPHFLFNSMNSIASLVTIDPERAEEAILDLSQLFRATLNNQKMLITAEEELELCKRYLNIEGLRLGERLKLNWQVSDDIKAARIPPLSLQPLLENAIYHGIQPLTSGGTIDVKAFCKDNSAYIMISNPFVPGPSKSQGNQIALDNIRSRFSAIFGQDAIIKTSQLDDCFTVTLRFPKKIRYDSD
ncbi:MAG: sensor histidine kinase [Oleiphilus sp.]|nr:MAG: sensor histidine kinase [Oleiphilus sp.]